MDRRAFSRGFRNVLSRPTARSVAVVQRDKSDPIELHGQGSRIITLAELPSVRDAYAELEIEAIRGGYCAFRNGKLNFARARLELCASPRSEQRRAAPSRT